MNVPIGERLRAERERLGMNQTELGAAAGGLDRKSQFNYETGKRSPDASYLEAAASLGIDVRYVITGSRDYDPPPALTAEEQTLLAYFRQAAPPVRKAALGALLGASAGPGPGVLVTGKVGQHIAGDVQQSDFVIFGGKKRR